MSKLKSSLFELLENDLEKLVTRTIEWDKERQPSIIERVELSKWLTDLHGVVAWSS